MLEMGKGMAASRELNSISMHATKLPNFFRPVIVLCYRVSTLWARSSSVHQLQERYPSHLLTDVAELKKGAT
jgi:hypothetical protein